MEKKLEQLEKEYQKKRENFAQTQQLFEKLRVELIGMEAQMQMLKEIINDKNKK